MNEQKKRAVIYCRVSTKEQVEEGNSLSTQEKACKEYAFKNGYEVSQVFIEQGESAKTANRTELKKLMQFCILRKNNIKAVIAYKIDRISRNTDDYSQIRLLLKRYGIEIKSTSEYFTNDPAGRFMENIIANVAQFDNDVRTERSVNGMKDAMREGRYVWRATLGYSNIRIHGKATIAQNTLAPFVSETFKKIAENNFPTEIIRREMTGKGLLMPSGEKISRSYFYRMLRNKLYAGWIVKFGECHKGLFEPIVSQEIFDQVQLVLTYRRPRQYCYQAKHPDFPLRRFISHPSGKKLTGCWSKGNTKVYPYYLFKKEKLQFRKHLLEQHFKTLLNSFELNISQFHLLKMQVKKHLVKENEENYKRASYLKKHIDELKIRQTGLIQKNLQNVISDNVLKEQLELLEQELIGVNTTLISLPDTRIYYDELLESVSEYLKNPSQTWEKMPFETKLKIQWFYFPKGIIFDGVKSQTPEVCKVFKVKSSFLSPVSPKVPLRNQKTNPVVVPTSENTQQSQQFWDDIGDEIVALADIKNGTDSKPSFTDLESLVYDDTS